jgi:Q family heterogeneous nuclear ribonucleoprotein R
MMDFSGSNRGYFFVRYTDREHAKMAVRELNNYEIRPGKYIGVIPSVDNRKLWISGIPKNRTSTEIQVEMERMTDGVRSVYIYSSHTDKSKTRGYAFVEYETHRAAALARRKLVPGRIFLFDQEIERVDWAEPENEVDDEIMATVKVLFIRNLTMNTSEEMIWEIFDGFSQGQVERIKKAKDYAFIHFTSRDAAERAFETTKRDLYIDESLIEVTWSKPIDRQIHNTRKQLTKALTSGSS